MSAATSPLAERAAEVLPGGVLGSFALPPDLAFVPVGGDGPFLRTADGRVLLDCVLGGGPLILGHRHPGVLDAARAELDRGMQVYNYVNEPALRLAAELVEAIPCAERVRFATSGSEATMYALRYARAHTGRTDVVKFEGAYHGNHDVALLSAFPRAYGEPVPTPDSAGIPPWWSEHVHLAAFNDLDSVARALDRHRGEIAAVIVEPYQRVLAPQPGFLEGLRQLCNEHGALLVFDEVVTGFRIAPGGAQERFGVTPDLATYGKIIGGGFPLSAVAGPAAILDRSDPRRKGTPEYVYQSGTINGQSVACAAGLATLAALRDGDGWRRLRTLTDRLHDGLRRMLAERGVEAVVLGEAGMWHVLFTDRAPTTARDVARADGALLRRFHRQLLRRDVFVLVGVRSYLSLAHGHGALDRLLDLAGQALDAALRGED